MQFVSEVCIVTARIDRGCTTMGLWLYRTATCFSLICRIMVVPSRRVFRLKVCRRERNQDGANGMRYAHFPLSCDSARDEQRPAEQKKVFALTWQNCDEKVCLHLQYIGLHQCSKIFDELNAYFFAFFKY